MSFKYTANTLKKLEQLFEEASYIIRYEKGNFNSGYCILEDRKVVVINKFLSIEARIVIDSSPDFRYQMLRAKVKKLDAIIFTHGHKDHIAGLDDVRAYNYHDGKEMQVYATAQTQQALKREFEYVFQEKTYPGIP